MESVGNNPNPLPYLKYDIIFLLLCVSVQNNFTIIYTIISFE